MKARLSFDASKFNSFLKEMVAAQPGKPVTEVINQQASAILSTCVTRTKKASAEKLRLRAKRSAERAAFVFSKGDEGLAGPVGKESESLWARLGAKKYNGAKWRLPDGVWAKIVALKEARAAYAEELRKRKEKYRLESRGLSARSWVGIGAALGIPVKAAAYIVRANYKGKAFPENSGGSRTTGHNPSVTLINSSPTVVGKLGGAGILASAMSGRANGFFTAMAKANGSDIAKIVGRFSGLKMKR